MMRTEPACHGFAMILDVIRALFLSTANQSPDDGRKATTSWLCHDLRRHPDFDFAVGKSKVSLCESLILPTAKTKFCRIWRKAPNESLSPLASSKANLCLDDPSEARKSW
jgi:hypothetical protein